MCSPSLRRPRWAPRPAEGIHRIHRGPASIVSNVAADGLASPTTTAASHSRSPIPRETRACSACCAADRRVPGRLIPNACVGPPSTSRLTSSAIAVGASPTSTRSTSTPPPTPSATARAMVAVFPNIDSNTTSARVIAPPHPPGRLVTPLDIARTTSGRPVGPARMRTTARGPDGGGHTLTAPGRARRRCRVRHARWLRRRSAAATLGPGPAGPATPRRPCPRPPPRP